MHTLRLLIFITAVIFSSHAFSQNNDLLGTWVFDRMPAHLELDAESEAMSQMFFADLTLVMDEHRYQFNAMNKTENGDWKHHEGPVYLFTSDEDLTYIVRLEILSTGQLSYTKAEREWILKKSAEQKTVPAKVEPKVKGIEIDADLLFGQWNFVGTIKNGKENDFVLKHNDEEPVSYRFTEDWEFINKAILGEVNEALYTFSDDMKTIEVTMDDEVTDVFKVVVLNENELQLYRIMGDLILKFERAEE
jgi:hypothetical protein